MRMYGRSPCHYALGKSMDSACGIYALWDRGLNYSRDIRQTTCGHCLRWLRKEAARIAAEPKVVSA